MARWKKNVKEEVEKAKEPEVVADGVVRDVGENPIEDNPIERKPRIAGNWKKVTFEEMADLELAGKLVGYDPASGEALVK
jgi:hypothetical protein